MFISLLLLLLKTVGSQEAYTHCSGSMLEVFKGMVCQSSLALRMHHLARHPVKPQIH